MLSLVILGGGINSAVGRAHVSALRLSAFELVGGYFSRNNGENQLSASRYGDVELARNFTEFLDLADVADVALIATPTPQHFFQVENLLLRGNNVICEKALATNVQEAEQLCRLAAGPRLLPVLNYSSYPLVRDIRHLVRSNQIGAVHHIRVRMPQEGFMRKSNDGEAPNVQSWRLTDGEISTVSLDLGVHVIHLVRFILGRLASRWTSVTGHYGIQGSVLDNVVAIGIDNHSTTYSIEYGKVSLGYKNGLEIEVFGEQGSIYWLQSRPDELRLSDTSGQQRVLFAGDPTLAVSAQVRYQRFKSGHPTGFVEGLANMFDDMHSYLSLGHPPTDDFGSLLSSCDEATDDLRNLKLIESSSMANLEPTS